MVVDKIFGLCKYIKSSAAYFKIHLLKMLVLFYSHVTLDMEGGFTAKMDMKIVSNSIC